MSAVFFSQAERRLFFVDQLGDRRTDLLPHAVARHGVNGFEIDAVEQLAVNRKLQLLILQRGRCRGSEPAERAGSACVSLRSVSVASMCLLLTEKREFLLGLHRRERRRSWTPAGRSAGPAGYSNSSRLPLE